MSGVSAVILNSHFFSIMSQRKAPPGAWGVEVAHAPPPIRSGNSARCAARPRGLFGAEGQAARPEGGQGVVPSSPGGRAAVGAVGAAADLRPGLQMEAAPDLGPGLCCKPGGRLDMSHGFVHHIRRNQLARYRPAPAAPSTPRLAMPGCP